MNASEKNSFEEQWRDAFENAELSPDPTVWATIETHLAQAEADKYKRKLYLFKLRVAAAVALFVLATGTWTLWQTMNGNTITIAPKSSIHTAPNSNIAVSPQVYSSQSTPKNSITNPYSSSDSTTVLSQATPLSEETHLSPLSDRRNRQEGITKSQSNSRSNDSRYTIDQNAVAARQRKAHRSSSESEDESEKVSSLTQKPFSIVKSERDTQSLTNIEKEASHIASFPVNTKEKTQANSKNTSSSNVSIAKEPVNHTDNSLQTSMIASLEPLDHLPIHTQMTKVSLKDIRWYINEAFWNDLMAKDTDEKKKKSGQQSRWQLNAGITPGSFNPNFHSGTYSSLQTSDAVSFDAPALSASNTNKSTSKDLGSMTRSGTFYATALQTEFAISERLSIQGGVQYSYSNSTIDVTQYTMSSNSSAVQPDFYELFSSSTPTTTSTPKSNLVQNNGTYRIAQNTNGVQSLDNTYQYIGFPMKLIYKVFNRRVKASIGAGIATDLFLKSQIGSNVDKVETLEFERSQNSIYKNTIVSGLLSIKFDYAIDGKYSIYIEPAYRRSLTSAMTSSTLSSFPGWWGVGTGVMYRF